MSSKVDCRLTKIKVIGVCPTVEYQKSKYIAERLHHSFPDKFQPPEFRPFLDVSWTEYIDKLRRQIGGLTWVSKKQVAVFINDIYVGDDENFQDLVDISYNFRVYEDFNNLGVLDLQKYLNNYV